MKNKKIISVSAGLGIAIIDNAITISSQSIPTSLKAGTVAVSVAALVAGGLYSNWKESDD